MKSNQVVNDDDKQQAWSRFADIRDACDEDGLTTLPLLGLQDGKFQQDRTGVLLAVAEYHFIVTAAHDLKKITRSDIPLYVPAAKSGRQTIQLRGRVHGTEEKCVDLAIIELAPETTDALRSSGRNFLRVTDMDTHARPIPGYYLVRGYPLDCRGQVCRYSGVLYDGEWPSDSDYPCDPSFHLLLEHTKMGFGNERQSLSSPRISGMSGCGIWRLTTRSPQDLADWSLEERKLVAIQTKCKPGSFMKGTWIRYVFALIRDKYPDLERMMTKLYIPT